MSDNPLFQWFLIDDDKDDQEIFSMALQDVGQNIKCYYSDDGVQALEMLEKNRSFVPNCIFIDMNMPRMNGIQCLQAIKNITRLEKIPVFMYSTSADQKSTTEAKIYGAEDFIIKPASIVELSHTLNKIYKNLNSNAQKLDPVA